MQACRDDPVRFLRHWCWTYDPRETPSHLPFDPFARQAELLLWLRERERNRESGLIEKSRDMGLTWLCCAYALHGWLFRDGFSCGFGSRKLDLVDRLGDPDSVLEKVRMLIENLPGFLVPRGYRPDRHAGWCKILNPANGSTITGEGGDQIGRGGRKALYFVDEAAFLERPQLVERSLSQTTNVRIDVSTPNGPGNPFATKRHSGKVPVFRMHWRDDPRKTQGWIERMKALYDSTTIAQEVEIDYAASVEGVAVPGEWVRAAVEASRRIPSMMGKTNVGGLDVAEFGRDDTVLVVRSGAVVFSLLGIAKGNTTQTAFLAAELARKQECKKVYYDVGGIGAGIRGAWDSSGVPLGFVPVAVNAGESPTDLLWPDKRTSRERFANLKAELWWLVRQRFERTFEAVTGQKDHPPGDLISIPNDAELIAQLSLPLVSRTDRGKIQLESKRDMRRRGVKSPDRADALVLAFHPDADRVGTWGMRKL